MSKLTEMIPRLVLIAHCFFAWSHGIVESHPGSSIQAKEPISDASRQWLEEVVPYIITSREKDVFLSLPTELDRGQFIETFWKKRDPNPQTPENEFKIEYYRRIALANKFFGAGGIPGWKTDRGRLLVLLGPPGEILRDLTPSASVLTLSQGPKETWQYWGLPNPNLPYNLEFTFVDKFGTGNYVLQQALNMDQGRKEAFDPSDVTFQFNYLETISEAMKNPFENLERLKGVITTQVTYNLIPFHYGIFSFKGMDKRALIPLIVSIPYASLPSKRSEFDYFFSINLTINVSDSLGQVVFEASKDLNFKKTATELEKLLDSSFRFQTQFSLDPGDYRIHLLVLDNYSGKVGTAHQPFSVPDLSADGPAMSDIVLFQDDARTERPAEDERDGLGAAVLRASTERIFRSGDELSFFFEVYNLSLDKASGLNNLGAEYAFIQAGKVVFRIPDLPIEPSAQKDCRIRTSFRLKNLEPGSYSLEVKINDGHSGKKLTKAVEFTVVR